MKKSRFNNILLISLSILVLAPIATYLVVLFIKFISLKFDYIYILGTADTWINFFGSLFGGSITMLVLYYTIKESNAAENRNRIETIKPCVIGEFTSYDETERELVVSDCVNNYDFLQWKLSNISNNLANDVRIIDEYSLLQDVNYEFTIRSNDLLEEYGISIYTVILDEGVVIKPGGLKNYKTNFSLEKDINDNFKFGNALMFQHCLIISYYNIENSMVYKTKFDFIININIDINDQPHLFLWSISNKYIDSQSNEY